MEPIIRILTKIDKIFTNKVITDSIDLINSNNKLTFRFIDDNTLICETSNGSLIQIIDSEEGTFSHKGLVFSEGTNVDQVKTITKNLQLIADWQDTGIQSDDIPSGSYIIQLYANDSNVGGKNVNEYYTGILSWYDSITNTNSLLPSDEIVLHRAGGSNGDTGIYLRTYRCNSDFLKLQIFSNVNNIACSNYVFSFRKII